MKSSVTIPCDCGRQLTLESSGTQPFISPVCPNCHTTIFVIEPRGNPISIRILNRAWAELENKDFTLVIVFSAMAVECELAYLFFKWKELELSATRTPAEADKNEWEKQWRDCLSVTARLDEVSKLLTEEAFGSFLSHNGALLKPLHNKFPNSRNPASLKDFLQKEFFDKRNKIVHRGQINFQQADAEQCFSLAATLRQILSEMDSQRNKRLQAELKAG
ncbi:MAG TPA: hypothetical protein VGV68_05165 [Terriglobia bacterium]|nr:hypothetical protein [Terriglobia bacterium]